MNIFFTNKGLTLLEVLIAVVLSAIVLGGLYSAVNAVLTSEEILDEVSQGQTAYAKLFNLFQRDLRTMINPPSVENSLFGKEITLVSTHSLLFNSSLPVKVRYHIDKREGRRYLCREELEEDSRLMLSIRLLEGVDDLIFLFSSNDRWVDQYGGEPVVRMEYLYGGKIWRITGGKLL